MKLRIALKIVMRSLTTDYRVRGSTWERACQRFWGEERTEAAIRMTRYIVERTEQFVESES